MASDVGTNSNLLHFFGLSWSGRQSVIQFATMSFLPDNAGSQTFGNETNCVGCDDIGEKANIHTPTRPA